MTKLVEQGKLDGTRKPLYATERELNGIKDVQLPLGIGSGERPVEELPMFAKEEQRAGDDGAADTAIEDRPA